MFRPGAFVTAAVLLVLFPPGTRADILSPGTRQLTPQLRFDNLDDYPDYRFYLQYRRGEGNPYAAPLQVVAVVAGQPVALTGGGRNVADLALLAAPRDQPPPALPHDTRGPAPDFPGFLCATNLEPPVTTTSVAHAASHYVMPYWVAITDGQLELTALPVEGDYSGGGAGGAALPYWPVVLAAAVAAVFAGAGIWLVRRRAARARTSSGGGPTDGPMSRGSS
jgi:hypothetical protein